MKPQRVTVYCSSSNYVSPMFFSEAEILGRGLAENNIEIVYGGANLGLMGKIADSALRVGGKVHGVVPEYFNKPAMVQEGLTDLTVVDTLLDRKRIMIELADTLVAFPGGIGTMDELTEVLALKQVGEIGKPLLFVNLLDFWSPFFDFLTELQQQRMVSANFEDLYTVLDGSEEVLNYLSSK